MSFNWKTLFAGRKQNPDDAGDGNFAFRIEFEDGIAIATATRKPTVEETRSAIDCLAHSDIYQRRVWDLSDVEFPYSMDDLRKFADYGKAAFKEKSRYAIVVRDDVGYGSIRAFAVRREQEHVASGMVFRSLDKAIEWLKNQDVT